MKAVRLLCAAAMLASTSMLASTGMAGAQVPYYVVRDLGLDPRVESIASAINNQGHVVGSFNGHAFLYDGATVQDLGTLTGGARSWANDINEQDQVVGVSVTAGNAWRACLWQNGLRLDLGDFGGNQGMATAINNLGVVVGWAEAPDHHRIAFRYDGALMPLGLLPVSTFSEAFGINDSGAIVGESGHAFLWKDGLMTDLRPGDPLHSIALAINQSGTTVGMLGANSPYSNGSDTWAWLPDLSQVHLAGTMPAVAVNNVGVAVGLRNWAPALYDVATAKDYSLVPRTVFGDGWKILRLTDINDNGQITGYAVRMPQGGYSQAVRLDPLPAGTPFIKFPKSFVGGATVNLQIEVGVAAPIGGWTCTLDTSLAPGVHFPPTVLIPEGSTGITVPVPTSTVTAKQSLSIRVHFGPVAKATTFAVTPNTVQAFTISPLNVRSGGTATGTLTLALPATADGATVSLASSMPSAAWPVTGSVLFAAGEQVKTFTIQTGSVALDTRVSFSATAGGATRKSGLTVKP